MSTQAISLREPLQRPIMLGYSVCAIFFGIFFCWSWLVPLERAAMAPGTLVVEGSRRQIQHLDGGLAKQILVREGTTVEANQPLVILDDTLARTQYELLEGQLAATQTQAARLRAEAENKDDILFPAAIKGEIDGLAAGQERIFLLRREATQSQIELLNQRNKQSEEEIIGVRAEIAAQERQMELIDQEISSVRSLLSKGLERTPRLLALERGRADIQGAKAQNKARIAKAEQAIIENRMRILDLKVQVASDAAQKLRDEDVRIADIRDRLRIAKDTMERTVIVAPIAGKIVNLKLFTENGVINPRDTLMEIVPTQENLVIDAQISPNDVDMVHADADVSLRFSSLPQRNTPVLKGRVETIAADRQTDARTGQIYYTARIVPLAGEIRRLGADITPGLPVEVRVNAGQRTLFQYLFDPLLSWHRRALIEK